MAREKSVLFFWSVITLVVVSVSTIKAADPLCEGLPPNEIFPIPHETNCSRYYECFNGDKTEYFCDDGLYYNPEIQTCDFPANAGCDKDPLCQGLVPNEVIPFPHETNCSLYYECLNGNKTLLSCDDGLYYNEELQSCDFPDQSGCKKDPLCQGLPPNEVIPFPHESNCSLYYECLNGDKSVTLCPDGLYYNEKIQSCDFPALSGCSNGDPQCSGKDLDYLPNPDNCTMYVECYDGDSYPMSCPNGYWFDSVTKQCVLPEQSDCVIRTTPSWTTPHSLCWGVRPNQIVLIRFEGDCSKYWRCDGAQLSEQTCPNNLFFDAEREMCDFPEVVNCDDSTRTPNPLSTTPGHTVTPPTTPKDENDPRCSVDPQDVSYWPHPVFCDRYIECYHDFSYEMTCPGGYYFSDAEKKCVPPSQSECGRTTNPPRTTVTGITSDPDCPYPEAEGKLLPYPGDCTQFYECAEGQKVAMPCPDGLWFNAELLDCDYPYQTYCPWGRLSFIDFIYSYFVKIPGF